jgi:hypothetical protein
MGVGRSGMLHTVKRIPPDKIEDAPDREVSADNAACNQFTVRKGGNGPRFRGIDDAVDPCGLVAQPFVFRSGKSNLVRRLRMVSGMSPRKEVRGRCLVVPSGAMSISSGSEGINAGGGEGNILTLDERIQILFQIPGGRGGGVAPGAAGAGGGAHPGLLAELRIIHHVAECMEIELEDRGNEIR